MSAWPAEVQSLFWDVDPEAIDLDAHRDYVMERVMSRGGWVAMSWLRGMYDVVALASFLQRRGARLAPRERAYWSLIAEIEVPAEPGGGRPRWSVI